MTNTLNFENFIHIFPYCVKIDPPGPSPKLIAAIIAVILLLVSLTVYLVYRIIRDRKVRQMQNAQSNNREYRPITLSLFAATQTNEGSRSGHVRERSSG